MCKNVRASLNCCWSQNEGLALAFTVCESCTITLGFFYTYSCKSIFAFYTLLLQLNDTDIWDLCELMSPATKATDDLAKQ